MAESGTAGHRQRLRDRFVNREQGSDSDEALLELLLTYAIPQRDVLPLAKRLLVEYVDLASCLDAPLDDLCRMDGIKTNTATLIKLVDRIRRKTGQKAAGQKQSKQLGLPSIKTKPAQPASPPSSDKRKVVKRYGTALFSKALVGEAVNVLPLLPDSESLDDIRAFLQKNLRFNSELTRSRNANYIIKRMFGEGYADKPLRDFAWAFVDSQALREVCFYRFMRAEQLECDLVESLLLPNIGVGSLPRAAIRKYLTDRYPESRNIADCGNAVVEALKSGGIVKTDAKNLSFAYRDIPIPSFAFILHSEFPEPGMFDIAKLEQNRLIRAMLWNPERIVHTLYELRNQGLISKISEIDGIRQFTTKYILADVTAQLIAKGKRP
jgi:DNA repair protein RadC